MPRRNFEDGAEIVIEDFNALTKAIERTYNDGLLYELIQRTEDAFFGDSFFVSKASANSVAIKKGSGFQTDSLQASPEPTKRLLYLSSDQNVLIDTPDSSLDRIDIVCVAFGVIDELSGSRKVKDAISNVITTQSLVVQKEHKATIQIVAGTPGVSPVAPATPSGYLKIAEILVTAVSGIVNSGDVTDSRVLMPIGGSVTLDTTGFERLSAGGSVPLSQLLAEIDALLKNGYFNYFDLDDLGANPAAPGADKQRLFVKDGVAYLKDSASVVVPLGSGGGGGGGGANWQPVSGVAPVEAFEYDEKVWNFEKDGFQSLTLWIKVPTSYLVGRQVSFRGAFYSPGATNNWKMQATATLIRKNNDAIDSVAHQEVANSGDVLNAVAKRMREVEITASTALGTIDGLAINPGDIIKLELKRIVPTGTEDVSDVRFIPSSTEVLF